MEKKYYWLKLKDDFFEDKPIKKLRKIAGGDTYTIIYLKMLLAAIKQGNKLYFEGVEDTFAEELALELNEDEENVSVTLRYLQSKGLLKVLSEEEFLLIQCDEMVGSETDSARRQRLSRSRRSLEQKEGAPPELPSPRETQIKLFERLQENYSLSDTIKGKMAVWFKYKTERKEAYKEQGMKSLLKKVESNAEKYGDVAVVELIEECMSNNWKGIIWDKLSNKPKVGNVQNRVSEVDNW